MGTGKCLNKIQNSSVTDQGACWSHPAPSTAAGTAQGNAGTSTIFCISPVFSRLKGGPHHPPATLFRILPRRQRHSSRRLKSKDIVDKMTGPQYNSISFTSHSKEATPGVNSSQKRFLPTGSGSQNNLTAHLQTPWALCLAKATLTLLAEKTLLC